MEHPIPGKYRRVPSVKLVDRKWPNSKITQTPIWCSVDLRDGNQALPTPMGVAQKLEFFKMLVSLGFKQIEVGFPSASDTEFNFVRKLIDDDIIPRDVTIQVLVPAREDFIKKTIDSLVGARKVIIHLYNSTSPAQRKITFGLTKSEVVDLAVRGTEWIKKYSVCLEGTEVTFQYSPESFSQTELPFSLRICRAVMAVWQPTPANKMILNLPATVEAAMPNHYADQIEWFITHLTRSERKSVIMSVHTHNDRGTGIAATELALLAGADRVEGTLFGNGERTGNADLVTLALNLYTHGVDPMLDFSSLDDPIRVYEKCTGMNVPVRQPYAGGLVFTAFSGSHQDAISKGFTAQKASRPWRVPYLPVDPSDLGRAYKPIRVNSQSGKGGIAYLLEKQGIYLPTEMRREFGQIAGKKIDALGREASAADLFRMFWEVYGIKTPYKLQGFSSETARDRVSCWSKISFQREVHEVRATKKGPVHAFVSSLKKLAPGIKVLRYKSHSLDQGASASAIAYVLLKFPNGQKHWGAGMHTSVEQAPIMAVVSALNRGSNQ